MKELEFLNRSLDFITHSQRELCKLKLGLESKESLEHPDVARRLINEHSKNIMTGREIKRFLLNSVRSCQASIKEVEVIIIYR